MNSLITQIIKIVSPIVMIGAIFLEIEMIYFRLNHRQISNFVTFLMIIGGVAIIIHIAEGIIAAFLANKKGFNPLKYGIYTFFVGTVGLFEILEKK